METNDEWRVELAGSVEDLQYLSQYSRPPNWQVIEEEDRFSLIGTYLRECKGTAEVRQHAAELLDSFNGAAKLQRGAAYGEVTIGEWVFDGTQWTTRVEARQTFRWRVESLDGKPAVDYFELSTAMVNDRYVAEALGHFQNQEYWAYSHNKILEVIMMDMDPRRKTKRSINKGKKRILELEWTTCAEIKAFEAIINDRAVLGKDARHAIDQQGQTATPNESEERARQAKAFIANLLRTWLVWKYEQRQISEGNEAHLP
jgi:hypothetical protein